MKKLMLILGMATFGLIGVADAQPRHHYGYRTAPNAQHMRHRPMVRQHRPALRHHRYAPSRHYRYGRPAYRHHRAYRHYNRPHYNRPYYRHHGPVRRW